MKFTDGQWLLKKEFVELNPSTVFDTHFDGHDLFIFTSTKEITDRSKTIDQGSITFKISSPIEDIIRVESFHFDDYKDEITQFELNHDLNVKVYCDIKEGCVVYKSGALEAVIDTNNFKITYFYKGEMLTSSLKKATGYMISSDDKVYMKQQLEVGVGECVYGLGERFTHFVKNGQNVEMWNEDGGTSSEVSYKNIPFYITNKNYGVFVNHPERVSFEVASENVQKVQFSVEGERMDYMIIGGGNMKQVLVNYTSLTGKPALPPYWSFGLWLSTSFTTNYDEKTVMGYIDGMAQRQIPLQVFHFDCYWMKAFQWCDFIWDSEMFPDPKGLLSRIKAKGLKICVWINPYIAQKSELFKEAKEKGYLLKKKDGKLWQWDRWQAGMGIVDFTNPKASAWYKEQLKALVDMGVDTFKTDFGERIPTNVVYYNGADPMKMHNYYTQLYNEVVYELLVEEKGREEAIVFARSATAGGQKFPVHWGGDCWATYPSMAESLRGGLSLCMSGFGYWSHDIGGFESTATPDLYKRWVAFGMMSTHSRLHGSKTPRVPWLFDEEASDVLRHFTKIKCSLMPYLFSNAAQTAHTGIPMMRAMVLEFPQDPACKYLDTQYMLGPDLLIAPIFNEYGEVTYYLPQGQWTDFVTGEAINGGGFVTQKHDYLSLPINVRPGTIIPVGSDDTSVDYDFAMDVTLHVFNLEEGIEAKAVVCGKNGEAELTVQMVKKDNLITVSTQGGDKPWSIMLRGAKEMETNLVFNMKQTDLGVIVRDCHLNPKKFTICL